MISCDLDKAIRESSLPCLAVNFILLYQVRKLHGSTFGYDGFPWDGDNFSEGMNNRLKFLIPGV